MLKKISMLLLSLALLVTGVMPAFAAEAPENPEVVIDSETVTAEPETTPEVTEPVEVTEPETTPETEPVETTEPETKSEVEPADQEPSEAPEVIEPEEPAPSVSDVEIKDNGFGTLHIDWATENANMVKVSWSTNETFTDSNSRTFYNGETSFEKTRYYVWGTVYVRVIPYNGEKAGEPVMVSGNIFDSYKPSKIVLKKNVKTYGRSMGDLDLKVLDKAGREISWGYYTIEGAKKESFGNNKGCVIFRGLYKDNPKMTFDYKMLPPTPTRFIVHDIHKNDVELGVDRDGLGKAYDYIEFVYADNKNFKNYKAFKVTNTSARAIATKLKTNTRYYARVKYVKKVGKNVYKSDFAQITFRTSCNPPWPDKNSATTRKLLYMMNKNNKSFTFVLPGPISGEDAALYMHYIECNFPQYFKFDYSFWYEDHKVSKIKFTYVKSEAVKANRLKAKINSIIKYANRRKGTAEKVKYINWRIKKACTYNNRGRNCINAYGCLVEGKAVCNGYAYAFNAIMKEMNIPSEFVASARLNHIWNKVRIGKKWYHVDVTWNDTPYRDCYLLTRSHPM